MPSPPPGVDPGTWQEYLDLKESGADIPNEPLIQLNETQYWALLEVYEPAAATLDTGSDGPGCHVPLMDVLGRLGLPTNSRWEAAEKARPLIEAYETNGRADK